MNTGGGHFALPCSWIPAFAGMTLDGYPATAGQTGISFGSGLTPEGSNWAK
jgi:hypothetical protein